MPSFRRPKRPAPAPKPAPRKHRFGDVLSFKGGSPLMLLHQLPVDEDDSIASGGWEVLHLYETRTALGPMFGLREDRDHMLPQYTVVADAD